MSERRTRVRNDQQNEKFMETAFETIQGALQEVKNLEREIDNFRGTEKRDPDFEYMKEVMISEIITLDNMETRNLPDIKQKKKEAILFIQRNMKMLDRKLLSNQRNTKQNIEPDLSKEENYEISIDGSEVSFTSSLFRMEMFKFALLIAIVLVIVLVINLKLL